MTHKPNKPFLSCACGYTGNDYKLEEKGQHTGAYCPQCARHIKWLSKDDKYGTKEQQREIWDKTGGTCCFCGKALNPFEKKGYTYEHIQPQTKNGSHETENLYPCCEHCNSQKQNKTLTEYREYMKKQTGKASHVFHFEVLEYGPTHISEILKKLLIR